MVTSEPELDETPMTVDRRVERDLLCWPPRQPIKVGARFTNSVRRLGERHEAAEKPIAMLALLFRAMTSNIALVRKLVNGLTVQTLLKPPQPTADRKHYDRE